ncbi:hypothetical protein [Criibacterium bergeronii]|uniref:hypothetical protein n=1 Tax=Criibacterium bergeronii TaxID=1871336 RepID=UPI001313DDFA|nr:hypothetical protein [Criibacterium bergeronii]
MLNRDGCLLLEDGRKITRGQYEVLCITDAIEVRCDEKKEKSSCIRLQKLQ